MLLKPETRSKTLKKKAKSNYVMEDGYMFDDQHNSSTRRSNIISKRNSLNVKKDYTLVHDELTRYFNMGRVIGSGKHGDVYVVTKKSCPEKRFSLKQISKKSIQLNTFLFEQELKVL